MYGDNHIKFLQWMMHSGCVTLEIGEESLAKIYKDENEAPDIRPFLDEINAEIDNQGLKIHVIDCEVTDRKVITLVSTISDDVSKTQTEYTPIELEYFHKVLQEIVGSHNKRMEQNVCLNLACNLSTPYSIGKAEKLIEKWCDQGYLVLKDGELYFGSRTIFEYSPYFMQHYKDDVHKCNLCFGLLFKGKFCSNCGIAMHNHCSVTFFRTNKKCPNCKKVWVERDYLSDNEEHTVNTQDSRHDTTESSEDEEPANKRTR